MCQVVFSMFNKLLICLCLADLLFLVSNLAISPIYAAQVDNIARVVVDSIYWISTGCSTGNRPVCLTSLLANKEIISLYNKDFCK